MSQDQWQQSETLNQTVAKTINELREIQSRSERTDEQLSKAFYKGVLLFLRYNKQALLATVIETCSRLRVDNVEPMLTWVTQENLVFQRIEGISIPVTLDKEKAIFAFVGKKKTGASLFTLLQQYQNDKRERAKETKQKATALLVRVAPLTVMKSTEKSINALSKKFPQCNKFFTYLLKAINDYRE